MMRKIFSAVLIAVFALGVSSVSFAASFSDVPSNHWAYGSVEKLVKDGVIKADGKNFNGNSNATRYDMAIMLAGLFQKVSKEKISASNPFNDVPENTPAYEATKIMAALGVMEGYGDGSFQGDKEIDRQGFALTLDQFLKTGGLELTSASVSYSDVPQNHWAYKAISRVTGEGFMDGYSDGTFKGSNKITKFELAMIIAKVDDKYFS